MWVIVYMYEAHFFCCLLFVVTFFICSVIVDFSFFFLPSVCFEK